MATMTLDEMTAQLRAAYGDGLRAVVLYGSGARTPGTPPARGRYDLLVIVDAIGMEELRRVAPATRAWTEAGNPPPLTLTALEWRSSADVFPMEYADVLEHHRVLAGALPAEGIAVDPRDLRRQLEHQTLGKLLQLRSAILASGNDAKRLLGILEASRGTILVLFRSLARVHGRRAQDAAAPADAEALAEWAGRTAGFDPAPFVRMLRHVARTAPIAPGEAAGVLGGYLSALEQLVAHVSALPVAP